MTSDLTPPHPSPFPHHTTDPRNEVEAGAGGLVLIFPPYCRVLMVLLVFVRVMLVICLFIVFLARVFMFLVSMFRARLCQLVVA